MREVARRFGTASPRVGASWWRRLAERLDWVLVVTVLAFAGIGLLNLYSATYRTPHSVKFDNQVMWMLLGLVGFVVVSVVDYRAWSRVAWIGLGGAIATLILLKLVGNADGAQRWLSFGPLRVQPSEIAKIAVIIALARLLQDSSSGENPAQRAWAALGILVTVALIASQPDLGTSILVVLVVASVSLLLARNLWPAAVAAPLIVAALPLLWRYMRPYQKARVFAFLDPTADPTGSGWHTQQSIFAIGSGRMTGKGFLNATQNHFNFLPEYWTDFPFSVWAEEWGFVGSVALLAGFVWLIMWIVNVAFNARDTFGTAICLGVAAMVFWHTVINIAMVLGLAPVVGLTLPLISYGGSSLITFFLGLGLVCSVSVRRRQ